MRKTVPLACVVVVAVVGVVVGWTVAAQQQRTLVNNPAR